VSFENKERDKITTALTIITAVPRFTTSLFPLFLECFVLDQVVIDEGDGDDEQQTLPIITTSFSQQQHPRHTRHKTVPSLRSNHESIPCFRIFDGALPLAYSHSFYGHCQAFTHPLLSIEPFSRSGDCYAYYKRRPTITITSGL